MKKKVEKKSEPIFHPIVVKTEFLCNTKEEFMLWADFAAAWKKLKEKK